MYEDLTLQQGFEKFQKKNAQFFSERKYSKEGETFLKCHDITHVVFACDTTIYGEGVVKLWITFGTTLGFWKVINGYNEVSAFQLFRMYSFKHVIKNIFRLLFSIPKGISRARQMSKPWPFLDYEPYLNTPVSEIRKEFNIQVIE